MGTVAADDLDGHDLVKVVTYQCVKGLEFKQVFLPRPDADGLREQRRPGEDQASLGVRGCGCLFSARPVG